MEAGALSVRRLPVAAVDMGRVRRMSLMGPVPFR
jgi:hypothetical protein